MPGERDDGLYVVSGGDDGACKLWDCGRLERDVSFRSRLTYASQGGRVTALVSLDDDDRIVASASDNGSVHAWRVEYVERKGGGGGGAASGEGGGGFGASRRDAHAAQRGEVHGSRGGGDGVARRRRRHRHDQDRDEDVVLLHRARGYPGLGPAFAV